jgi:predicted alpha/beta superfamily hydrolase
MYDKKRCLDLHKDQLLMKRMLSITLMFALYACSEVEVKKNTPVAEANNSPHKFYSKEAKDTFYIFVSAPKEIQKNTAYPVVFLLDANLYFDPMAATFARYSEVGLLPEAILVGVGYKDMQTMDSLRDRDLTYPTAIAEYEMDQSGSADKFLSFIDNELIPYIDKNYPAKKDKRVLMGHSLGGYFTLFALQQHLKDQKDIFFSYIAASPSTDYNHCYILNALEKAGNNKLKTTCYTTFGGLEDSEEPDDTTALKCPVVITKLETIFRKNNVAYVGEMYSSLAHMHTGYPTFVKGLQMAFMSE